MRPVPSSPLSALEAGAADAGLLAGFAGALAAGLAGAGVPGFTAAGAAALGAAGT